MDLQNLQLSECLALPDGFFDDSVVAFSTLKTAGNLAVNGADPIASENLKSLLNRIKLLPQQLVIMRPQHGDNMHNVLRTALKDSQPTIFDVDVLVCRQSQIALGLASADCLPVFFYDPVEKIIALTHAGRAGLELNIIYKTLERLLIAGCDINNLRIYIGPGINPCCYRLPAKLFGFPKKNWSKNLKIWETTSNSHYDARGQLQEIGLRLIGQTEKQIKAYCQDNYQDQPRIISNNYCTCCATDKDEKPLFFSHVRSRKTDEPEGRFLSLIMLE